ncbi:MAG: quinolinate synthase NadA [Bacteroidetes bacterium]|nr:MAG: quinolinate synthase NadA [Bacteroidota bacterium]
MNQDSILQEILSLKKEKNAVILAHYYQVPQVQDVADHVGDSFALSKLAAELPEPLIVFCGVSFMAETAKILSPEKTVLLPVAEAGCPMADMVTAKDVLALREKHPEAAVVSYVNSSTEVKALSDICCTSANAVKVIRSLHHKQIIFLPDENLGSYAAELIPEKEFILFKGYCPIHEEVMEIDVKLARDENPDALFVVHPECRPEVRHRADFIGSTGQMIRYINESNHHSFIVGTESGILHPLMTGNPGKKIVSLTPNFICPNMKKTRLEHVRDSLQQLKVQIELEADLMEKARLPLMRMLEVS